MGEERLQRALARGGFGSRRSCEELIAAGKVTVNGTVATLGDKVDTALDTVTIRGATVNLDPNVRYLALNKPAGVVTTMRDPQGRPDIRSLLPSDGPRVFPVGRLDRESEGLMLLTNDGDLADGLTHPRYEVEKEYLVEVGAVPSPKHLAALRRGVVLDDGPARPTSVRIVDAHGGRGQLALVLTEGRKREIRRMLDAIGLPVTRLVRVRIGPIRLGRLTPGALRPLTADEVLALARVVAKAERRLRRQASGSL
ncbi:MAG: rRNA pseudouridine synthase [Actinomycetota bacterium]|nr:rRNA pseudouridine synthase [Actinomycetota bacterium]